MGEPGFKARDSGSRILSFSHHAQLPATENITRSSSVEHSFEAYHWKRPQCRERLKVGGEGDDRRWDGWMVSQTRWTWVWESSRCWWWTGKPGVLQFMGSQRVGHDWVTELNCADKQSDVLTARKNGSSLMPLFKDCIGYRKHKKCTWCPLMKVILW